MRGPSRESALLNPDFRDIVSIFNEEKVEAAYPNRTTVRTGRSERASHRQAGSSSQQESCGTATGSRRRVLVGIRRVKPYRSRRQRTSPSDGLAVLAVIRTGAIEPIYRRPAGQGRWRAPLRTRRIRRIHDRLITADGPAIDGHDVVAECL